MGQDSLHLAVQVLPSRGGERFARLRNVPKLYGVRMPLYVYEPTLYSAEDPSNDCCSFETLQSLSEAPLTACPMCGCAIHRALTTFAFSSAGGGSSTKGDSALFRPSGAAEKNVDAQASSAGGRAARMAMRHVCASGCRH